MSHIFFVCPENRSGSCVFLRLFNFHICTLSLVPVLVIPTSPSLSRVSPISRLLSILLLPFLYQLYLFYLLTFTFIHFSLFPVCNNTSLFSYIFMPIIVYSFSFFLLRIAYFYFHILHLRC